MITESSIIINDVASFYLFQKQTSSFTIPRRPQFRICFYDTHASGPVRARVPARPPEYAFTSTTTATAGVSQLSQLFREPYAKILSFSEAFTWASWRLKSPTTWLFSQKNNEWNIIAMHLWPFVRGIFNWLVHSPLKGSLMRNRFQRHDVIMVSWGDSTGSDQAVRAFARNLACYSGIEPILGQQWLLLS